jgi:hypothetical protein
MNSSVITSKPAICGRFKTGHSTLLRTVVFDVLMFRMSADFFVFLLFAVFSWKISRQDRLEWSLARLFDVMNYFSNNSLKPLVGD